MRNRRPSESAPTAADREMTERDWKAFYLVFTLLGEISAHGARALDTFIDAMVEMRAKPATNASEGASSPPPETTSDR